MRFNIELTRNYVLWRKLSFKHDFCFVGALVICGGDMCPPPPLTFLCPYSANLFILKKILSYDSNQGCLHDVFRQPEYMIRDRLEEKKFSSGISVQLAHSYRFCQFISQFNQSPTTNLGAHRSKTRPANWALPKCLTGQFAPAIN